MRSTNKGNSNTPFFPFLLFKRKWWKPDRTLKSSLSFHCSSSFTWVEFIHLECFPYSRHTTNSFEATITTDQVQPWSFKIKWLRRAIMPIQQIPIVIQFHCLLLFMFVFTCMPEQQGLRTPILGLKLGLFAPTKTHTVCLLLLSWYELFPNPFFVLVSGSTSTTPGCIWIFLTDDKEWWFTDEKRSSR